MKRVLIALVTLVFVLAGAAALLRIFVYDLARMDNLDMWPSVGHGSWLLVSRRAEPKRGDMVVLEREPGKLQVRRIVALPGERVAIRGSVPVVDGQAATQTPGPRIRLYGQMLTVLEETIGGRRWRILDDQGRRRDMAERKVDGYFVLADNRDHATDSREFGAVPRTSIRGVVQLALTHGDDPSPAP